MKAKTKAYGFGFNPSVSEHHFEVSISSSKAGSVLISEHMSLQNGQWNNNNKVIKSDDDKRLRVILSREKWNAIADAVKDEFNRRLRQTEHKHGAWKVKGIIPVSRLFGKELVLLAWAIEEADSSAVPAAIMNWRGLTPEERWWLFTMTNAATGQAVRGKSKGWRKAVRYSLTENPISAAEPEQWMGLVEKIDNVDVDTEKKKKSVQQGVLTQYSTE